MKKEKATEKEFQAEIFRLRRGENMCGDKTLWLDLNGQSYVAAAMSRREGIEFSRRLRVAANWIEAMPNNAFRKNSK